MSEPKSGAAPSAARRRHLGGGVLASTASQVATLVTAAVTSVLIARILGPDGLGAFALAASLAGASVLVVGMGVKQGIIVLVGSGDWPRRFVPADLLLPLLALGALGGGLVFLAYELLRTSALQAIPPGVVPVLAGAVVFALAWQWSWSLMLALERYEAYAIVFVAPPIATLAAATGLALAFEIEGAIVGIAAGHALAGVFAVGWARRGVTAARVREAAAGRLRRLRAVFSFGLKSWASEVLRYSNMRLDLFFVAAFTSAADVGRYSVAVAVAGIGLVLPVALSTTIMSRTASLVGASRRGEGVRGAADISDARACRHAVLMLPPSALIVTVLLLAGIPLFYGSRFEDSVTLGLILLPGVLLLGLSGVLTSIVHGRGRPDYALYAVLITVPPTLVAYLLVIPDTGATGAAVVSLCSYAAAAVVAFLFFRRVTGLGARAALVPTPEEFRAYYEVAGLAREYVRTAVSRMRRRGD